MTTGDYLLSFSSFNLCSLCAKSRGHKMITLQSIVSHSDNIGMFSAAERVSASNGTFSGGGDPGPATTSSPNAAAVTGRGGRRGKKRQQGLELPDRELLPKTANFFLSCTLLLCVQCQTGTLPSVAQGFEVIPQLPF